MKQFIFCLLFMLATTSAAFADNTPNTIATVQEFADDMPNPGNMPDAIHTTPGNTLPDCTCANAIKATDPVQGNILDHTPAINGNDDCVRVTQTDGIFIIDCGDLCRMAAPVFGVSISTLTEAYADGIVDWLIYEGDKVQATHNGQTASFPICE